MAKRDLTANLRSFRKNPKSFIKENAVVPLELTIEDSNGTIEIVTIDPRTDQVLDQSLSSGGSLSVRRQPPGTDIP